MYHFSPPLVAATSLNPPSELLSLPLLLFADDDVAEGIPTAAVVLDDVAVVHLFSCATAAACSAPGDVDLGLEPSGVTPCCGENVVEDACVTPGPAFLGSIARGEESVPSCWACCVGPVYVVVAAAAAADQPVVETVEEEREGPALGTREPWARKAVRKLARKGRLEDMLGWKAGDVL